MGRKEPCAKRQSGLVHDRASSDGSLPPATLAFPCPRLGFELPTGRTPADGADETVRPALLGKVRSTGGVVRERSHELLERIGTVFGPAGGHAPENARPVPLHMDQPDATG